MIDIRQYAYPMDALLMDKILASTGGKVLLEMITANDLDTVCDTALGCSYIPLPENHPMYEYLAQGQKLFGGEKVRTIYLTRNYDYDIACHGFSHPVILVPKNLVEKNDADILRARMYAGAASVAMGHHKIEFLIWLINCVGGNITLPFASEVLNASMNEWYRSRQYTLDRAVYLASGDIQLALRNILYGRIPFEMLGKYSFGTANDSFMPQILELEKMTGITGTASKILGIMQHETWLPNRYRDLLQFEKENRGGC